MEERETQTRTSRTMSTAWVHEGGTHIRVVAILFSLTKSEIHILIGLLLLLLWRVPLVQCHIPQSTNEKHTHTRTHTSTKLHMNRLFFLDVAFLGLRRSTFLSPLFYTRVFFAPTTGVTLFFFACRFLCCRRTGSFAFLQCALAFTFFSLVSLLCFLSVRDQHLRA